MIDHFREAFSSLLILPDVKAVYAQIAELDPGEGSWHFADTVLVVGTVSCDELQHLLQSLQPDRIGTGKEYGAPSDLLKKQGAPVLAAWRN